MKSMTVRNTDSKITDRSLAITAGHDDLDASNGLPQRWTRRGLHGRWGSETPPMSVNGRISVQLGECS